MTEIQFFRLSVALPMAVPLLAWLAGRLGSDGDLLGLIAGVLVASALIGGVPYVVCTAITLAWLWNQPVQKYRLMAVLAPVLYVPFLAAWIQAGEVIGRPSWAPTAALGTLGVAALLGFAVGYSYVGLVLLVRRALFGGSGTSEISAA